MVKNYMIASLLLGSMLAGNACALGGYDYGDFYDPYGVDTDDDYYSGGDGYFYAYPIESFDRSDFPFGRRLQVSSTLDDYTSWYVNDANGIVVTGAGDEALVESGSVSVVFEGLDDETSFGLGFGLSLGLSLADMFGKALGESGLLDN